MKRIITTVEEKRIRIDSVALLYGDKDKLWFDEAYVSEEETERLLKLAIEEHKNDSKYGMHRGPEVLDYWKTIEKKIIELD